MSKQTRERALKLWLVLNRAHAAIAEHARLDVQRSGLSHVEFAALEALFHKGPLLVGELQERVLVSSGGMTYVVDQLEKKGYAERRPCPSDRRARYAALTPAGEALMGRIFPAHAACMERVLSGLSGEEQERATDLLRALGTAAAGMARCGEADA